MDDDWIVSFLRRVRIGHVSTVADGQPFVTPTSFWYDAEDHRIYCHSAAAGRLHDNVARGTAVCFEASLFGDFLPSNIAMEFSVQYESVIAFGRISLLADDHRKRRALLGLIGRYFPNLEAGRDFRSITERELRRTAVYEIRIEEWSGKRNWPDRAEFDPDWSPA